MDRDAPASSVQRRAPSRSPRGEQRTCPHENAACPRCRVARLWATSRCQVERYLRARCPVPDVDDLLSEVFLVALRRPAELPGDDDAATRWLLAVAPRRALANHRRGRRRQDELAAKLALWHEPHREPSPDAIVADRLTWLDAARSLPPRDLRVPLLVAWQGCSVEDAATRLDRTADAPDDR